MDIPKYSALSEAIVKLTREGMGKIVNVVVNFLSQVIFIFLLFQLHLHTLPYPKTKEKQKLPDMKN